MRSVFAFFAALWATLEAMSDDVECTAIDLGEE